MDINLDKKKFLLVDNSEKGTVNTDTVFEYSQNGNIVTAVYYGGSIQHGNILATLKGRQLDMVYLCLTNGGDLKAGKALADITMSKDKKLMLSLQWQWLNDSQESGTSEYIEY